MRDNKGPSFGPFREIVRRLSDVEDSVRLLRQATTTTVQQTPTAVVDDPIEGQIVIDGTKHKWYSGGAWHEAGGSIPTARMESGGSFTTNVSSPNLLATVKTNDPGTFEYNPSADFGIGAVPVLEANSPGEYMIIGELTFVVNPTVLTHSFLFELSAWKQDNSATSFGDYTLWRSFSGSWVTVNGVQYMTLTEPAWLVPSVLAVDNIGVGFVGYEVIKLDSTVMSTIHP